MIFWSGARDAEGAGVCAADVELFITFARGASTA